MNAGEQTTEWLYREQLQVDDKWATRLPKGFKWWADKQAQTIEVIGQEVGPGGGDDIAYLLSVRTEFLRDVDGTDRQLTGIHAHLMPFAAMAGPVYDAKTRTVDLCSLVKVHSGNRLWMSPLISLAAILQIGEARVIASELAKSLNATEALSGHPKNGIRPRPDELAGANANLPLREQSSRWSAAEFQDVVGRYMRQPPSLGASAGGPGLTVEFPYGDESSLCLINGTQPHPRYGNGLFLLQSFPVEALSDLEGARLALALNAEELGKTPSGYGFGSFTYRDGAVHFTSFLPNAAHSASVLPNLYFACAGRARAMSVRLLGCDWAAESFEPRRSALGRSMGALWDEIRRR